MDRVIPVLVIVAIVLGWNGLIYKQSAGRMWNPLWIAFTLTGLAVLNVVAGAIGYTLDRHDRFVAHSAWAGHVIWSQIEVGILAGLGALYFWRKGLQGIRPV
jgi:hypothetical protein